MRAALVVFGQPAPQQLADCSAHWVHLTSAGYERYDEPAVRRALVSRQVALTTSSSVYAEPCAEHLLAMMLATARQLPALVRDQDVRRWDDLARRRGSFVLRGQSLLLLGYGAIGRRLAELCVPFELDVVAVRRERRGDESVVVLPLEALDAALGRADHVVSALPGGAATRHFANARRFAHMKPGSFFYNVGRGSTVDQAALMAALASGRLGGAYLDVTEPEPLPPEHPLWSAPRCFITPHTAGGRATERIELVRHFVENLGRFVRGEPLVNRVI